MMIIMVFFVKTTTNITALVTNCWFVESMAQVGNQMRVMIALEKMNLIR